MRKQKTPILHARGLKKSFTYPARVDVLKSVSIDLFKGQSIAIMGASGEGKSTLLQILGTLEVATGGLLNISGAPVTKRNAASLRLKHIGFIFQSFHLLGDYTALQNVLVPALIAGRSIHKGSLAYKRGMDLLEKVGLSHRASFSAELLSGGEKQRVAIARALCNNPDILLADEPSGNLDQETSFRIQGLLMHCVRDLGKGLIVVTHDKKLAQLCDSSYRLSKGMLIPVETA